MNFFYAGLNALGQLYEMYETGAESRRSDFLSRKGVE